MSRSPVKASEPIMPGAKREPSSFIQATTMTSRAGVSPCSASEIAASSAAMTPAAPSNFPPVGWLSR